jgi:hypothetical protein
VADWNITWGIFDDIAWIEEKLGLTPGRYRYASTGEKFDRIDPHYNASYDFAVHRYTNEITGEIWDVAMREVSNGIWALGFRKATA